MPTLSEIDHQIKELEAQKRKIVDDEKKSALKKVDLAIQELNALGFSYALTGGTSSGGKRRTGIRKEVMDVIAAAQDGIARSELLDTLEATSKAAKQSVSNALSALKKANQIEGSGGHYKAK